MAKKVKSRALRKKFKLSWLLILPFLIVLYFAFSFKEGATAPERPRGPSPQKAKETANQKEDYRKAQEAKRIAAEKAAREAREAAERAAAAEAKRIQDAIDAENKRIKDELDRIAREAEQRRIASLSAVKKGR